MLSLPKNGTVNLPQDAETPSEIDGMFDQVTYSKGGGVIRMMVHAVGEEEFMAALGNYLTIHR